MRVTTKISICLLGVLATLDILDAIVHRSEPAFVRSNVLFAIVSIVLMVLMFVRERRQSPE